MQNISKTKNNKVEADIKLNYRNMKKTNKQTNKKNNDMN